MESDMVNRVSVQEMIQKPQPLSFLGRASFVPRPFSQVTEIYDTDIEDEEHESEGDSASTLSSPDEINTPHLSHDLTGYHFHVNKQSVAATYEQQLLAAEETYEDDGHDEVLFAMAPTDQTPKPQFATFPSLNMIISDLDESLVRSWTPEQVAEWMTKAGFGSDVVDRLLDHDICGSVLLDLQFEDLKELDIQSFGKRRQLMNSIHQLRGSSQNSTPISPAFPQISRTESHRRGRHSSPLSGDIAPAESISIVAIEQVLPKPHKCSKGENCPKWQKQQRKIQQYEAQLALDMKSVIVPSVVGSSDVLGPSQGLPITLERLSTIEPRDPLENVRNFLDFQHVNSPGIVPSASVPAELLYSQNPVDLPRLTIPTTDNAVRNTWQSPITAVHDMQQQQHQAQFQSSSQQDPYHYMNIPSPADVYRVDTPMSTTDIPTPVMLIDPCQRGISSSVPPEMKYGNRNMTSPVSINRSQSTSSGSRHLRRPSFVPNMAVLREDLASPSGPPVISESDLTDHKGWMRKRKTTRLMRHEWQDNFCSLSGAQLDVSKDEISRAFQSLNVDEYTLHAYATASSSKLSAAFKKNVNTGSAEPTFAFSLIPEDQKSRRLFEKEKSHHFAVTSGRDRVEWMRKLMLAKAMKKNDGQI